MDKASPPIARFRGLAEFLRVFARGFALSIVFLINGLLMKIPRLALITCSLLAATVVLPFTAARGTEKSPPSHPEPIARPRPKPVVSKEATFNLDFRGGSVADLLGEIAKATGKPPNVIVSERAGDISIPPFRVAGITLNALFRTLTQIGAGNWFQTARESWALMPPQQFMPPAQNTAVSVFNVAPLLENHKITDIVAAVQLALGMGRGSATSAAQIKYHKETELLLVFGDVYQLNIAKEVLRALETQKRPRPQEPSEKAASSLTQPSRRP